MSKFGLKNIPSSVAIIMDGNRRWAKKNGCSFMDSYKCGIDALMKVLLKALEIGIPSVVVYAFSAENALRVSSEVGSLVSIILSKLSSINERAFFPKNNIRVSFLGDLKFFPEKFVTLASELSGETLSCSSMHLGVALNYGSRQEILSACKELSSNGVECTEKSFLSYLYTKDFSDIDLLIRSGGEKRLSNFLLWNLAYAELYFSDVLWPDFDENEFLSALHDYSGRIRRYGR